MIPTYHRTVAQMIDNSLPGPKFDHTHWAVSRVNHSADIAPDTMALEHMHGQLLSGPKGDRALVTLVKYAKVADTFCCRPLRMDVCER